MKVLTILLLLVAYGEGAKILALLGVVSRSHHIFNKALTHALAERGHQAFRPSGHLQGLLKTSCQHRPMVWRVQMLKRNVHEIQQFLDGAKDGFIFFSLGSNLRSSDLPEEKLQALLDALAELPQRILWKFESDKLQVLPSNVKIGKWLPQSDILGHPKIRAFISHCGKMSTTESLYRGVPVIGVPFLADQWLNLQQMMAKGVAVKLDFMTLTKESVLSSVLEILNNESYQFNMKKMSEIFKDHPETALDRAIFWTEYVIRHGGAPHLRPASTDIYWYQYLLLDVLVLFSAAVVFIFTVIYFTLKKIVKFLKRRITKKLKNS